MIRRDALDRGTHLARKAIVGSRATVRDGLARFGLVPAHRDYVRFVILSGARTGSNLLRGMLNRRDDTVVFGEIFRDRGRVGYDLTGYRETRRDRSLAENDPLTLLEERVFRPMPLSICAVGFKLFYHHARDPVRSVIWGHLMAMPALRVVHLLRRNHLRSYVSLKVAESTGEWVRTSGSGRPAPRLELAADDLERFFTTLEAQEAEARAMFAEQPMIEMVYERLVADLEGEGRRLQEFLGLQSTFLTPATMRQGTQPMRETVANYADLKAHFAATRWAGFFED